MLCSLSKLDDAGIGKIKSLEEDLGKKLLSFSCHELSHADLDDSELQKVKSLESSLGVSLIAVQ